MNTRNFVINALQHVIGNPEHDAKLLEHYFSEKYQQRVNGVNLDYHQFVEHMALLKRHTKKMILNILALASEDYTVFTQHHVDIEKSDGEQCSFEVFANFTIKNNKIVSCVELTRLLAGSSEDDDMGSRR